MVSHWARGRGLLTTLTIPSKRTTLRTSRLFRQATVHQNRYRLPGRVAIPPGDSTSFTNSRGFRRMNAFRQFVREEDGQDVVEYGLLIATIAIVVLVGISFFGTNIEAWFRILANRITTNT
jgi:Flp pilus assembly pilin Flp